MTVKTLRSSGTETKLLVASDSESDTTDVDTYDILNEISINRLSENGNFINNHSRAICRRSCDNELSLHLL